MVALKGARHSPHDDQSSDPTVKIVLDEWLGPMELHVM
jgi:hypothetical protein